MISKGPKKPRPTELDRKQMASIVAVVIACIGCSFVDNTAVKIIATVILVALVIGLGARVYRDRTGRW